MYHCHRAIIRLDPDPVTSAAEEWMPPSGLLDSGGDESCFDAPNKPNRAGGEKPALCPVCCPDSCCLVLSTIWLVFWFDCDLRTSSGDELCDRKPGLLVELSCSVKVYGATCDCLGSPSKPYGVFAADELAADALSAMVDADPFGAWMSTTRFWDAGVVKEFKLDKKCLLFWATWLDHGEVVWNTSSATLCRGAPDVRDPRTRPVLGATVGRSSIEIYKVCKSFYLNYKGKGSNLLPFYPNLHRLHWHVQLIRMVQPENPHIWRRQP